MSAENKTLRLSKVAKELNVGISTIVEYLSKKGIKIETSPNTKIDNDKYEMLLKAFPHDREKKNVSDNIVPERPANAVVINAEDVVAKQKESDEDYEDTQEIFIKTKTIDFKPEQPKTSKVKTEPKVEESKVEEPEVKEEKIELKKEIEITPVDTDDSGDSSKDSSVKILGKIDLDSLNTKTKPDRKTKSQKEKEKAEKK
ncbi:MAG: translation initiation factor IF-2 N-terminal domain-containing protein, partial [Bacteroidales bacterium]|nr:translation initiation factor IF-2 N-terminal domain-containing protein [Bacteroidales bacterium]